MAQVSEKQVLNWEEDLGPDGGLIYLSPSERLVQREDQLIPLSKRKFTNGELIEEIMKKDSEASRAELEKEAFKSLQRDAKKIKIDL